MAGESKIQSLRWDFLQVQFSEFSRHSPLISFLDLDRVDMSWWVDDRTISRKPHETSIFEGQNPTSFNGRSSLQLTDTTPHWFRPARGAGAGAEARAGNGEETLGAPDQKSEGAAVGNPPISWDLWVPVEI